MNVGILTFRFANNYGAVLQAHGLRQTLQDMGHIARFLDYVPSGKELRWWQGWGMRSGGELPERAVNRSRFARFRSRWLPATRVCRTLAELREAAAEFDALVVGSDQVWNGNGNGGAFDPAYFLDFGKPRCRRVSYAACFGDPVQPVSTLSGAGPLLRCFDFVSVRNRMSAHLVREISGRAAETVVDPTLLHDFSELLPEPEARKYIAVYFLPRDCFDVGLEVLRHLRQGLSMPALPIGARNPMLGGDRLAAAAGPVEWLRYLQNSSFICTNSFHGTVFAVRFRKPFIAWSAPSTGGFRGPARIQDFLALCGLENRLVCEPNPAAIDELVHTPIDYDAVFERLVPEINRSRAFLERALSQEVGLATEPVSREIRPSRPAIAS